MAEAKILPLTRPSPGTGGVLGPGAEFGPYQLVKLLGEGGMGQVYLAKHNTLGKQVAIKLLNPEAASQLDLVRRLFAEARVVNEINHENIVEIHDFVSDSGGQSYYVMELLRGEDLATSRHEKGPFTLERALAIAVQVCSALRAVHEKGVVHRDLKPENIFLVERAGRKDFVKIIDFGVAKVFDETLRSGSFTMAGSIVGTPEYMSPEQAGGRAVDGRSDVYTLGLILYWMLSDDLPFHGRGFDKLILARLTTKPAELPEPTPAGERLPRGLSKIVLRCLERDPADRFQTMDELAAALAEVQAGLASQPAPAAPPSAGRRLRPATLVALAVVLSALAVGGFWALSHRASPEPVPAPAPTVVAAPTPAAAPSEQQPQRPATEVALPPPPPAVSASHERSAQKHTVHAAKPGAKPAAGAHAPKEPTQAAPQARPATPAAKPAAKKLPPGIIDPFNE